MVPLTGRKRAEYNKAVSYEREEKKGCECVMSTICLKNGRISDARLWNVHSDVLVDKEEGRILEIGPALTGDEEVDLTGYTILPGLFDAHVHIVTGHIQYNDVALKNWAQAGVLTVRDLGLGDGTHADEGYLAWRETVKRPECAEILTAGQAIAAKGGYMHIMGRDENGIAVTSPEEARNAIVKQLSEGCDGVKTAMDLDQLDENTPQLSPEILRAIAEAAKNMNVWCCAHVLQSRFLRVLVENGIPEMAHMVTDPIPEDLLDEMAVKRIPITCTLQTINAPRPPLPPELLATMPPKMRETIAKIESIDTAQQERDAIENARRYHEKGGILVLGTDTMRMEQMPEVAAVPIKEFQLLYQAGLSVQEVLAAATLNAAYVCKVDDRLGSIEVGKQANLIAIQTPLDESFEALRHVEFVMHGGTIIKQQ
jgi:imidazolonepropionase-like amidohydrolase